MGWRLYLSHLTYPSMQETHRLLSKSTRYACNGLDSSSQQQWGSYLLWCLFYLEVTGFVVDKIKIVVWCKFRPAKPGPIRTPDPILIIEFLAPTRTMARTPRQARVAGGMRMPCQKRSSTCASYDPATLHDCGCLCLLCGSKMSPTAYKEKWLGEEIAQLTYYLYTQGAVIDGMQMRTVVQLSRHSLRAYLRLVKHDM